MVTFALGRGLGLLCGASFGSPTSSRSTYALRRCEDLGFDLVEGNLLEAALVLDISGEPSSAACR